MVKLLLYTLKRCRRKSGSVHEPGATLIHGSAGEDWQ